jgi:phosphoribosylglycinamide formyltransferase 1
VNVRVQAKSRLEMPDSSTPTACAIFISGNGTNLQAVIDSAKSGELPLDVRLVVSDNAEAYGLVRAKRAAIPTAVEVWRRDLETRSAYGLRLAKRVEESGARLVLLLGWMHVLAREFLEAGFDGVLNLHPAYLPDDPQADTVTLPDGSASEVFRGAHALRDAIAAGASMTGASLIEVTPAIDRGPVLARRAMRLQPDDGEEAALARLHQIEQEVVREGVLAWIARHRERTADDTRRPVSSN